jgi:hypothetical protein
MKLYPEYAAGNFFKSLSSSPAFSDYWRNEFDQVYHRTLDTWDYVWTFSCWANSGLTCTPRLNLVSNIGFGADATHCRDNNSSSSNLPRFDIDLPLKHPPLIVRNADADTHVTANAFNVLPNFPSSRDGALDLMKRGVRRSLKVIGALSAVRCS